KKLTIDKSQVEWLLSNCFDGLFAIDPAGLSPEFVVGDFNGDGEADVFLPVRLTRDTNRDHQEPNFLIQIVFDGGPLPKDRGYYDFGLKDLTRDHLRPYLIVVHSVARIISQRCPPRQDKFVLLFAIDQGSEKIKLFHGKRLPPGTIGDKKEDRPPPT